MSNPRLLAALIKIRDIREADKIRCPTTDPEISAMSLGEKLSKLRIEKSQSLQQVADAVGVSKAHIWEIEKQRAENPSMALVQRLADHFDVSISYLVDEDMESPDADSVLVGTFRLAGQLDPADRAIVHDLVHSLLQKRKEQQISRA